LIYKSESEGNREVQSIDGQEVEGEDGPVGALNWDSHNHRLQL